MAYRSAPAFTLGTRAYPPDATDGARISPGPKYVPDYKLAEEGVPGTHFGTGTRDQLTKVYISAAHNATYAGLEAPGPGTYPITQYSSPVASALSQFKNASRAAFSPADRKVGGIPRGSNVSPGPAGYNVRPSWQARSTGFAAMNDLEKGKLRRKSEATRIFVSQCVAAPHGGWVG